MKKFYFMLSILYTHYHFKLYQPAGGKWLITEHHMDNRLQSLGPVK